MYLPQHFKMPETELYDFIEAWSFGTLITTQSGVLSADLLPFLVDASQGCLYCHLARANPRAGSLMQADDLLVSFIGPHGYISPSWYQSPGLVPTWNYSSVQVRGKAVALGDPDRARWVVDALRQKHEAPFEKPWLLQEVPEPALRTMLDAIVCFRIEITSLKGKAKLSQNRTDADQLAVIEGLQALEGGEGRDLAESMEARRLNRPGSAN